MVVSELPREKHSREDGFLCELISSKYNDSPFSCFHSYLVVIRPDKIRAMHYHKQKQEWLALTSGKIKLVLENINTKERSEIKMDIEAEKYKIIHIPSFFAHAIKNIGSSNASIVIFTEKSDNLEDTIDYQMEI